MQPPAPRVVAVQDPQAIDPDYINAVLGAGGLLSRTLEGYEPREAQIAMARAVDLAYRTSSRAIIEAPTAVGKSLAYGVPAVFHATHRNVRTVIATANITLQEQLQRKDFPFLRRVLPWPFYFCLLKGRSNYLCLDAANDEAARRETQIPTQVYEIRQWAATTRTGDVSELPFQPEPAVWRRFSVVGEECLGDACPFRSRCFSEAAREAARGADIVVVNYHLLFSHIKITQGSPHGGVLPRYTALVLDEGHKAAGIARDFFGFDVTEATVKYSLKVLERLRAHKMREEIEVLLHALFLKLSALRCSPAYRARLKTPRRFGHEEVCQRLSEAAEAIADRAAQEPEMSEEGRRLEVASNRLREFSGQIDAALSLRLEGWAFYLDADRKGAVSLCGRPVDVSERLRSQLFGPVPSAIVTSATLRSGNSFEHVKRELGLPQCSELAVASPLDYARQLRIVVPQQMPEPNAPNFVDAVVTAFRQICLQARGRTLGLFTSYRVLDAVHADLKVGFPYTVLRQGDMPKSRLIEAFRRDVSSVLLGTESFWAGVDVQGEALSCLVIDRLPFVQPDDPILDAYEALHGASFQDYSIPRAAIAFQQGFGRLIRSRTDRGVVVVLDRRIRTKQYGARYFLSWLPPGVLIGDDIADVGAFLR